jgi:hypothetical protein
MTTLDKLRKIAQTLRLTVADLEGHDPEQLQDDARWDLEQLLPDVIAALEEKQ